MTNTPLEEDATIVAVHAPSAPNRGIWTLLLGTAGAGSIMLPRVTGTSAEVAAYIRDNADRIDGYRSIDTLVSAEATANKLERAAHLALGFAKHTHGDAHISAAYDVFADQWSLSVTIDEVTTVTTYPSLDDGRLNLARAVVEGLYTSRSRLYRGLHRGLFADE